jgi:DNA-directed DNA polymerase III PolC
MFKNFPSPHCHIQSLDSASTPKEFIKREQELGTGCITCTDHGTMQGTRHVYELAKKAGLTPILGVEAYFRDDNCPILAAAGIVGEKAVKEYAKYYHITLHALDQAGYEALVRVLSRASLTRMERHGSEEKPLFNWADLEELAGFNITFTTGCLVGMTQRHLINGREDLALAYFNKLQSMVRPGNLYIEVFPHDTSKQWVSGIFFTLKDGRKLKFYEGKTLRISGDEVKASEYVKAHKAGAILESVKNYSKWDDTFVPGEIVTAEAVEEFMDNDCMPGTTTPDSQKWCNIHMLKLSDHYQIPALISDDAHFAYEDEKVIQDVRLMAGGGAWRFYASYHRFTSDEAYAHFKESLGTEEWEFARWVDNNIAWAQRFKDFSFKARRDLPTKFYPTDTLRYLKSLIDKHERMDWQNEKYVARLKTEIDMLYANGTIDLLPYFFVCEEALALYEQNERLTGPGRGSAAGLLLSYLLGITHIDPLVYDLSMERFLTLDRIKGGKLPDIDMDLPSRYLLVDEEDPNKGWLAERFGDCVAQISTDTSLKLRSSIKDVARVRKGKVPADLEKLVKQIEVAPQGVEDSDFINGYEGPGGWVEGSITYDKNLQKYIRENPDDWKVVQKLMGLTRQKSRHASAYVVTNEPLANFIPLTKVGAYTVTSYTAKSVEAAGGIKMDFLVINILNDIQDAIALIQKRSPDFVKQDRTINGKKVPGFRQVPTKNGIFDVWDLPPDHAVFSDVAASKTETVFQLNTKGARDYLRLFNFTKEDGTKGIDSLEAIAAFTALDRPGPLDAKVIGKSGNEHNMLIEYAQRARGDGADPMPILAELLPETYGIIVFQEQVQRIFQRVGKTSAAQADDFRAHIGKKQMNDVAKDKEVFMPGAIESVGQETADALWEQMFTFGQYGFNKSHAVSYGYIGYVCAYLKHYYPSEWWTAVLGNADRNKIDEQFWRYIGHKILMPDISKSVENFEIEGDMIRAPLSLMHGIGKGAHDEIMMGRPYLDMADFVQKIRNRRIMTAKPALNKDGTPKIDSKTGNQQYKLGYSALHKGVVYALIISGAMDSLFAQDTDVYTKLDAYANLKAEINKSKFEATPEEFRDMNQMTRFQLRKQILPAYTEPILPMLVSLKTPGVFADDLGYTYRDGDKRYRFVDAAGFERLAAMNMLPPKGISVAVAGYILDSRSFKYGEGKKKHAMELQIDHSGYRIKGVRWAVRGGDKLPKDFPQEDLAGSVAIVVLSRWNASKPDFSVDSAVIVQPPLVQKDEEESA